MVVKNLVSATVTGLLLSAVVGPAPAAAQGTRALVSDSIFIQRVSSDGLLQARLGQLAEKKGSSPSVVEFGKRMVADYSKANEELKAAAKAGGVPGAGPAERGPADLRPIQSDGPVLVRQGLHGRGGEAP